MAKTWQLMYSANDDAATMALLQAASVVVLDRDFHPPLSSLRNGSRAVLGYLSLGEVVRSSSDYATLRSAGAIVGESSTWTGNGILDFRNQTWRSMVLETIIPAMVRQGFNGIFLDTIDQAAALEAQDPVAYAGMKAAAVSLVRQIHARYPSLTLMMNRGYDLLNDVGDAVQGVLAESLRGTWDFEERTFATVPASETAETVALLKAYQTKFPTVQLYSLDYQDPTNLDGVSLLYAQAEADGFLPLVSTLDLDIAMARPADRAGTSLATARALGILTPTTAGKMVSNQVTSSNPDYYRFTLAAGADVSLSLFSLKANADLDLLMLPAGTVASAVTVATSANATTTNESLHAVLTAGQYALRVYAHAGMTNLTTGYGLTIAGRPVALDGANSLSGGRGGDVLFGGAGADRLVGGAGADSYFVDNSGDVVVETASGGLDRVFASISYSLPVYVENLTLMKTSAPNGEGLTGVGNDLANTIVGTAFADRLEGRGGSDSLTGGAGADIFAYASLSVLYASKSDGITDFVAGQDKISLSSAAFSLSSAALRQQFVSSVTGQFTSRSQRVSYARNTGVLRYDSNGSDVGGLILQIATLTTKPLLAVSDLTLTA